MILVNLLKHGMKAGFPILVALLLAFGYSWHSNASEVSLSAIEGNVSDISGGTHQVYVAAFRLLTPNGYPVLTKVRQALTDPNGHYAFPSVPPGQYILVAYLHPHPNMHKPIERYAPAPTFYPGTTEIENAELVDARPNKLNIFNFQLLQASVFQISGRVANKPQSAALALYRVDGARGFNLLSEQMVMYDPASGSFSIYGLSTGKYILTGDLYFAPRLPGSLTPETQRRCSMAITVANSNISGAVLGPEALTTIDGQVKVDGDNLGRSVHLALQNIEDGRQRYETTANPNGAFRFSNIPSGYYQIVELNIAGAYVHSVRVDDSSPVSGIFLIPDTPRLHVDVNVSINAKVISGTVADWDTADAHAYILAKNVLTGDVNITETDQNGRFSIRNLAPGEYDLYAWTTLQGIAYQTAQGLREYENDKVTVSTDDSTMNIIVVPLITRAM